MDNQLVEDGADKQQQQALPPGVTHLWTRKRQRQRMLSGLLGDMVLLQADEENGGEVDDEDLVVEEGIQSSVQPAKERKQRIELPKESPFESVWYKRYVVPPLNDPSQEASHPCETIPRRMLLFRNKFRMPRAQYRDICLWCEENGFYNEKCGDTDALGRERTPLKLLVLSSLAILGRNRLPDDLYDETNVSGQTTRNFCKAFCRAMAKFFYPLHVKVPSSVEEMRNCEVDFKLAGFDGCIGCCDGTHLKRLMTYQNLRVSNTGHKGVTRTATVTVNFRRRVLFATSLMSGKNNDVVNAHFDGLIQQMARHALDDFSWERRDAHGNVTLKHGPYLLVDGGFGSAYTCLVSAATTPTTLAMARMSKWIGSVRKCVECFFGILKQRFAILENYMGHDDAAFEDIWFTCIALHNYLLVVDGLDVPFTETEQEVANFTAYMGGSAELDEREDEVVQENDSTVGSTAAVATPAPDSAPQGAPTANATLPNPPMTGSLPNASAAQSHVISRSDEIREDSETFRYRLAEHWAWRVEKGDVFWPSRTGLVRLNTFE